MKKRPNLTNILAAFKAEPDAHGKIAKVANRLNVSYSAVYNARLILTREGFDLSFAKNEEKRSISDDEAHTLALSVANAVGHAEASKAVNRWLQNVGGGIPGQLIRTQDRFLIQDEGSIPPNVRDEIAERLAKRDRAEQLDQAQAQLNAYINVRKAVWDWNSNNNG